MLLMKVEISVMFRIQLVLLGFVVAVGASSGFGNGTTTVHHHNVTNSSTTSSPVSVHTVAPWISNVPLTTISYTKTFIVESRTYYETLAICVPATTVQPYVFQSPPATVTVTERVLSCPTGPNAEYLSTLTKSPLDHITTAQGVVPNLNVAANVPVGGSTSCITKTITYTREVTMTSTDSSGSPIVLTHTYADISTITQTVVMQSTKMITSIVTAASTTKDPAGIMTTTIYTYATVLPITETQAVPATTPDQTTIPDMIPIETIQTSVRISISSTMPSIMSYSNSTVMPTFSSIISSATPASMVSMTPVPPIFDQAITSGSTNSSSPSSTRLLSSPSSSSSLVPSASSSLSVTSSTSSSVTSSVATGLCTPASAGATIPQPLSSLNLLNVGPQDAPYDLSLEDLLASISFPNGLECRENLVILFPGTAVPALDTYTSTFIPVSAEANVANADVMVISNPAVSLRDAQTTAEYAAFAINYAALVLGRHATIIPWSQGNLNSQWALKYWPSTRTNLKNYVGLNIKLDCQLG